MYRIMLIEDDAPLAEAMKKQLTSYGYDVYCAENFSDVVSEFNACKPELVLLDIMLPYRDGYYLCGEIRKISAVPIIFISSASENMNIVMACSCGGDDFISKPVDPMVLNAKVSAVLRRTYEMKNSNIAVFGGAVLDIDAYTVTYGEKSVELTKNELKILQTLLENSGKVVSRNALMLKLWQDDIYVEENTLSVNVGRLRRKLESCGLTDAIVTKPGSGYMIK
ncbi:MAG: response regulator transcription factor [Firmicutes bacterium]|nr:response regulator transcription factor [Candidatus Colimorpha enterica]